MSIPSWRRVGMVGAGRMAAALARGLRAAHGPSIEFVACDPSTTARARFLESAPDAVLVERNSEVVRRSDLVFLAIKPQHLSEAVAGWDQPAPQAVFVSIVAGATLTRLTRMLATDRVVRMMPNTPCLIGRGAMAYSCGQGISEDESDRLRQWLTPLGVVHPVRETQMDAVTGLSGSGPAFVFAMIEALADGGVLSGLGREQAQQLAAQTVAGAAEMVLRGEHHPGQLKDQVASPAGTTIAGLAMMERRGVRGALIDAVAAAAQRSRELAADE